MRWPRGHPSRQEGRPHGRLFPTAIVVAWKRKEIFLDNGRRLRVLDVVPFEEEDESPFVGLLKVEAT